MRRQHQCRRESGQNLPNASTLRYFKHESTQFTFKHLRFLGSFVVFCLFAQNMHLNGDKKSKRAMMQKRAVLMQ